MVTKKNANLQNTLDGLKAQPNLVDAIAIPEPNTKNLNGHDAWKVDDTQHLIALLSTLKLDNQFYRSGFDGAKEVLTYLDKVAKQDPYLAAQIVVYARTVIGMKTVNHLATALMAKYLGGTNWGSRFFTARNKKANSGGAINRLDDMEDVLLLYKALNNNKSLSAAMKKGFAKTLETAPADILLKYKHNIVDVVNLVRPNPENSRAVSELTVAEVRKMNEGIKNKTHLFTIPEGAKDTDVIKVKTLAAIMRGAKLSANTHEVANSEAGQIIAKAVKEGKLSVEEGEKMMKEQKGNNFGALLDEGNLGITAALLNINSMLDGNLSDAHVDKLCALFTNEGALRKGLIFPYQLDIASEVVNITHGTGVQSSKARKIINALQKGYELALPNLAQLMTGKTLVIVDMSGSMNTGAYVNVRGKATGIKTTAASIASKIGATIAKYTNADYIRFGSGAEWVSYNLNDSISTIQRNAERDMGGTNLACAWDLAAKRGIKYDRVVILSDNECNQGHHARAYKNYVAKLGQPYVYSVDLAAYGTAPVPVESDKVRYYSGYGFQLFDDIAKSAFKPEEHLDEIRKIKI
jgi:hypothetical protein